MSSPETTEFPTTFTLAPGQSIQLYCFGLDAAGGLAPVTNEAFVAAPPESVDLVANAQGVLVSNKLKTAGTVTVSASAQAADGTVLSATDQGTLTAPLAVRLVLSPSQPPVG